MTQLRVDWYSNVKKENKKKKLGITLTIIIISSLNKWRNARISTSHNSLASVPRTRFNNAYYMEDDALNETLYIFFFNINSGNTYTYLCAIHRKIHKNIIRDPTSRLHISFFSSKLANDLLYINDSRITIIHKWHYIYFTSLSITLFPWILIDFLFFYNDITTRRQHTHLNVYGSCKKIIIYTFGSCSIIINCIIIAIYSWE